MKPGEIGFDRRLRREWLDFVADCAAAHIAPDVIRAKLHDLLTPAVAESGERGARSKTITVLLRLWVVSDPRTDGLRLDALHLLPTCTPGERLALHWGLAMAEYPFFSDVVSSIGRLVRLQPTVSLAEVVRRAKEKWGDRERVARSARHVLQSIRDWGVLAETRRPGVYRVAPQQATVRGDLALWMIEAVLRGASASVAPLRQLDRAPALFPFQITLRSIEVPRSPRLELMRQAGDEDMVGLRTPASASPVRPRGPQSGCRNHPQSSDVVRPRD
ncbi:MAG: hypothetical protein ACRDGM_20675 [bacterium]